jgi:hypothetical protein
MTVPWQAGLDEAAMVMLTGTCGLTICTISLDVAGFPVVQRKLDVMMHLIRSPLVGI